MLRLTERLTKALQGVAPTESVESMSGPPAHRVELRLSLESRAALAADYEAGATIADLCAEYGLAKGSVSRLLHGAETPVRGRPMGLAAAEAAANLYQQGSTLLEVSQELGVAKSTIRDALTRAGVVRRPAARRRKTVDPAPPARARAPER